MHTNKGTTKFSPLPLRHTHSSPRSGTTERLARLPAHSMCMEDQVPDDH